MNVIWISETSRGYNVKNIIVIAGPTAVGKTKLSIDLAKVLQTEIISGDSMQVYRGMNIGTGKVTQDEMAGIPHHMLDIKEPDRDFSVAEYQKEVRQAIAHLHKKQLTPIVVGGSGLYIQSILYDYQFSEQKRDTQLTKELEDRIITEGNIALHQELAAVDPEQAQAIHPNNKRRLIRALEIYYTTGKTKTALQQLQKPEPNYDHFIIGLEMDRKTLYNQINQRVDAMLEQGLVKEVTTLYEKGYENTQAMKAIGYKELIPYVKGETDLSSAVALLKQNSRRYAKRQYTWFKNKMDIQWYNLSNEKYDKLVSNILLDIKNAFEDKAPPNE